jgi:alpha-glucosidase
MGKSANTPSWRAESGEKWYVGAITDWDERRIDLPTNFLKPGKYHLEIVEDGINANGRAEDYKKTELTITAGEVLHLNLASGGGWVAIITPVE